MKKIFLLLIILVSTFFINGSYTSADNNSENSGNNSEKIVNILLEKERAKYINMYQEIYKKSVIQQIEFESEIIIPDYFDFKYIEYTYNVANQLGLTTRVAFRLMFRESSFINTIISPKGAKGLMQLMPDTRNLYYKALRVDTLHLDKNQEDIYIGMNYMKDLHAYWCKKGNSENYSWKLSLASYNAGTGSVLKYKGIPPYKETNEFILYILRSHSNPSFYSKLILKREKYENRNTIHT